MSDDERLEAERREDRQDQRTERQEDRLHAEQDRQDQMRERRAENRREADRSHVLQLRDEVELLADQVHRFRGTLSAFMPRSEAAKVIHRQVDRELEGRVKAVEQAIAKRLDRRTITFWGAIVMVVALAGLNLALVQRVSDAEQASRAATATAVELSCEQRNEKLTAILVLSAERAENPEVAHERMQPFIELINEPPCEALTRELRN